MVSESLTAGIAVGAFVGGVGVGILSCYIANTIKNSKNLDSEKNLIKLFGEPTVVGQITLREVTSWIKSRQDLLKNGSKAVVMKANEQTMNNFSSIINLNEIKGNYLIITIVNENDNKSPIESALIKYDAMEDELTEALDKGNGMLVVTN